MAWRSHGSGLAHLAGTAVRLHLVLSDAQLYSFAFASCVAPARLKHDDTARADSHARRPAWNTPFPPSGACSSGRYPLQFAKFGTAANAGSGFNGAAVGTLSDLGAMPQCQDKNAKNADGMHTAVARAATILNFT